MPLAKRIIPCLDVDNGRVVKGVKFENIRDAGDPVEIARRYNEQGADEITFLDITASHQERDTTLHTVERMASQVFIPLTVAIDKAMCHKNIWKLSLTKDNNTKKGIIMMNVQSSQNKTIVVYLEMYAAQNLQKTCR